MVDRIADNLRRRDLPGGATSGCDPEPASRTGSMAVCDNLLPPAPHGNHRPRSCSNADSGAHRVNLCDLWLVTAPLFPPLLLRNFPGFANHSFEPLITGLFRECQCSLDRFAILLLIRAASSICCVSCYKRRSSPVTSRPMYVDRVPSTRHHNRQQMTGHGNNIDDI